MSFILDALKKSEAERARQSGPVLLDPRIAQPRRGLPGWALAVVLILVANLVVLAWVLLRGGSSEVTPGAQQTAPAAPVSPAPAANALPPPALPSANNTGAANVGEILPPATGTPSAGMPSPAAAAATGAERTIAPTMPAPAAPAATGSVLSQAEIARLPSAEDLRVSGVSLPALELSLHAWDPAPANRYILLNSQKLREGNTNSDGVTVEMITENGSVLRWRERRFVLTPGN